MMTRLPIKRFAARILFLAMIVSLILSVAYLTAECDHVCTGDGCVICYHLTVCASLLKTLFGTAAAALVLSVTLAYHSRYTVSRSADRFRPTLVALKVKLSD